MTAEIVVPDRSNDGVAPGESLWWLDGLGRFVCLLSHNKGEGFEVKVDGISDPNNLVVTPKNRRKFMLPNGQWIIPS